MELFRLCAKFYREDMRRITLRTRGKEWGEGAMRGFLMAVMMVEMLLIAWLKEGFFRSALTFLLMTHTVGLIGMAITTPQEDVDAGRNGDQDEEGREDSTLPR